MDTDGEINRIKNSLGGTDRLHADPVKEAELRIAYQKKEFNRYLLMATVVLALVGYWTVSNEIIDLLFTKLITLAETTINTIKIKVVPHLGWNRLCFKTFFTVNIFPFSKQFTALCSAPWY